MALLLVKDFTSIPILTLWRDRPTVRFGNRLIQVNKLANRRTGVLNIAGAQVALACRLEEVN